ncbi:MAG TPA: hypothetical protein VGH19_05680 [Verrucomicrobiae bacterium]
MKRIHLMSLGLAGVLMAGSAQAQDKGSFGRFGISYNLNFNVAAEFSGIGGAGPGLNPGLVPLVNPGDIQQFDDGFIGMDASGNAGGLTTFWGYNNASQIVGGNLQLSSTALAAGLSTQRSDSDLQHGVDLTYSYQLKSWEKGGWGLEGAFGWMPVGITDSQAVAGNLVVANIPLGFVPPVAPFTGTVAGPGPLLDTTTGTVIIPGGAIITGNRDIDASVFAFRFGPYLDYNLSERVSLTLSGGLSLAVVDSEFTFNELKTPIIGTPSTTTGNDRSSDLLVGGYLSARVAYWFTDNMNVFTGITYQNVGSFSQTASGRKATLDLGKTISLNVGLGFSF